MQVGIFLIFFVGLRAIKKIPFFFSTAQICDKSNGKKIDLWDEVRESIWFYVYFSALKHGVYQLRVFCLLFWVVKDSFSLYRTVSCSFVCARHWSCTKLVLRLQLSLTDSINSLTKCSIRLQLFSGIFPIKRQNQ